MHEGHGLPCDFAMLDINILIMDPTFFGEANLKRIFAMFWLNIVSTLTKCSLFHSLIRLRGLRRSLFSQIFSEVGRSLTYVRVSIGHRHRVSSDRTSQIKKAEFDNILNSNFSRIASTNLFWPAALKDGVSFLPAPSSSRLSCRTSTRSLFRRTRRKNKLV